MPTYKFNINVFRKATLTKEQSDSLPSSHFILCSPAIFYTARLMAGTQYILIRLSWIESDSISDELYCDDPKNNDTVISLIYLIISCQNHIYKLFLITIVWCHFFINSNSLFWVPMAIKLQLCYSTKFQEGESENLGVNIWNQAEAVIGKQKKGWGLWVWWVI